jgi:hypothetical protein
MNTIGWREVLQGDCSTESAARSVKLNSYFGLVKALTSHLVQRPQQNAIVL